MGMGWLKGDFGAPNPREALRWFTVAARMEYPPALTQMGRMLQTGAGTPKNVFEAVRWYRAAISAGDRPANIELAMMYLSGQAVHQDSVEAYVLLSLASSTIHSAPEGTYTEARKALAELAKSLSSDQKALAAERMNERRDRFIAALMRQHPSGTAPQKTRKPKSPKGKPGK